MSSKIYRVVEGRQISGVCAGLQACGRGTATGWRLLFVFGSLFWFIAVFVYIGMAVSLPLVKTANEARELSGAEIDGSNPVAGVEKELLKLKEMKDNGLIDEDEYKQMRKKALGL